MTLVQSHDENQESIKANLTYIIDTGVKPISATTGPGGRLRHRVGEFEERTVTIQNARTLQNDLSIEKNGFLLTPHKTSVVDFFDEDEIKAVYYPEIEKLIQQQSGATRILIFDHTLRSGDEAVRAEKFYREPVHVIHNDYTEWSGPQRARDLLPEEEADALLQHRMAIIQVWRAIREPIQSHPLAICDSSSVTPKNLIKAERQHEDRVGEIYQLTYNPDHKWFYFPTMHRDEALVFKVYDSEKDGRARFTAHVSFEDPSTPQGAPPRESIEVRAIAFFAPTT
jgi:hypothetical protein